MKEKLRESEGGPRKLMIHWNKEEEISSLKFNEWVFASTVTKSGPILASASRPIYQIVLFLWLRAEIPVLCETDSESWSW